MSYLRVKICGITSVGDAEAALRAGADALGFLVGLRYETADQLSPEAARDIVRALPPFVDRGGAGGGEARRRRVARLADVLPPGRHGSHPRLRISRRIVETLGAFPFVLAGGLTPENVAEAAGAFLVYTGVPLVLAAFACWFLYHAAIKNLVRYQECFVQYLAGALARKEPAATGGPS